MSQNAVLEKIKKLEARIATLEDQVEKKDNRYPKKILSMEKDFMH